jgi:small subunit ribosomal protein S20
LPVTKSVERELRTAERRQERNKTAHTVTKTEVKKANKAVAAGEPEAAQSAVASAIRKLDRAADSNLIHKNNAARKKSRLMKKLNKMAAPKA